MPTQYEIELIEEGIRYARNTCRISGLTEKTILGIDHAALVLDLYEKGARTIGDVPRVINQHYAKVGAQ